MSSSQPDFNELLRMSPADRRALEARRAKSQGALATPGTAREAGGTPGLAARMTRQQGETAFGAVSKRRFPELREEEAIGKYAATDEGRTMARKVAALPDAPPAVATSISPSPHPAKAFDTPASREINREATTIMKAEGVSREVAIGRAARRNPELAYQHSAETSRRGFEERSRSNS